MQVIDEVGDANRRITLLGEEFHMFLKDPERDRERLANIICVGRKLADMVVHEDGHAGLVNRLQFWSRRCLDRFDRGLCWRRK
jgi:hypothetical protein